MGPTFSGHFFIYQYKFTQWTCINEKYVFTRHQNGKRIPGTKIKYKILYSKLKLSKV